MTLSTKAQAKLHNLMQSPRPCSHCGEQAAGAIVNIYDNKIGVTFLCQTHMPKRRPNGQHLQAQGK